MDENFYCLETANLKHLFNTVYPQLSDFTFSFSELLDRFVPEKIKTPEVKAQLQTPLALFFQKLRAYGVENHEDIDFCFSELSQHSRFSILKNQFHQYLDEIAPWDLTTRLCEFQETIFQSSFTDFEKPIIFIKSLYTNPGFQKVETAFSQQGARTSLIEPWQLPSPANSKIKVWPSEGAKSLKELEDYTLRLFRYSPNLKPLLFWGGSEKEKNFFNVLSNSWKEKLKTFSFEPLSLPAPFVGIFYLGEDFFEKLDFGGFSKEEIRLLLRCSNLEAFSDTQRIHSFFQNKIISQRFRYFTNQNHLRSEKTYPFKLRSTLPPLVSTVNRLPPSELPYYSSSTQLETYSTCPKQYEFRYLYKLRDQKQTPALVIGKTLHASLEYVLKNEKKADLLTRLPLDFEDQKKNLPLSAFETQFYLLQLEEMGQYFSLQERALKELFPGFSPQFFEESIEFSIFKQTFKANLDRIDLDSNQNYLIYDYKTGNVDFSPNQIEKGQNFQALLYLIGASQWAQKNNITGKCLGILFYDFKKKEVRRGLLNSDLVSPETAKSLTRGHAVKSERFNEILELGSANLFSILHEIKNLNFKPKPSKDACLFCDFNDLCEASAENVD